MNIFYRRKFAIIIINFLALISVFYFSFYIYPSVSSRNKFDYKQIKTNAYEIYSPIWYFNINSGDNKLYIEEKKKELLKKFIIYVSDSQNLKANAPCPKELVQNNLRIFWK